MVSQRSARQWPAWVDDILAYGPIAELEAGWRVEIGDAIVRVMDSRAGLVGPPKCVKCGSLKTLSCTIVGCGLPRPPRRTRLGRRFRRWL